MTAHAGTLLRAARTARGLRQWELARDAGMNPARLSSLETGADHVRPGDAARLAPVLGITSAVLLSAPRRKRQVPASPWRAVLVRSFKDIPASCLCGWAMTFEGRRPSGWALETADPRCRHHGNGAGS